MTNLCSVCETNPTEHVVAVPAMPVSMGYCVPCLRANAHPWIILVAGTAMNDGLENCAPWWAAMVQDTIDHLKREDRTLETFNTEVAQAIKEMA